MASLSRALTIHDVKNTGKEKLVVAFFVTLGGDPTKEVGE